MKVTNSLVLYSISKINIYHPNVAVEPQVMTKTSLLGFGKRARSNVLLAGAPDLPSRFEFLQTFPLCPLLLDDIRARLQDVRVILNCDVSAGA